MLSSYENIALEIIKSVRSDVTDEIREELQEEFEDKPKTSSRKYRRMPVAVALELSRDKIADCGLKTGHTLQLREGRIVCVSCDAQWKDEGF